jgi:hypothetical protein
MTLEEQNEIYKDRWLTIFVGGYSTIGVVSGIDVSVSASITDTDAYFPKIISTYSGICCVLCIVLLFWAIRSMYDFLAFHKDPTNEKELNEYKAKKDIRSQRGKRTRKILEILSHIFLVIQMAALIFATI